MRKSTSIPFAVALIVGIAAFAPAPTQAAPWCTQCEQTGECIACCRCNGGSPGYCAQQCYFAPGTEASWAWNDEALGCTADPLVTADGEAASAGDSSAPPADEAPGTDEPTPVATR